MKKLIEAATRNQAKVQREQNIASRRYVLCCCLLLSLLTSRLSRFDIELHDDLQLLD